MNLWKKLRNLRSGLTGVGESADDFVSAVESDRVPTAPDMSPPPRRADESTAFRIRPYRDGDEDDVVSLWKTCNLVRPWNNPRRDIDSARTGRSSEIFVAVAGESEERIVGSVMAGYDGHRGWVYYVAAHPEHRSRGLGGQLMRHAEAWLEGRGAPKVMLMIREENEGVRRFYEGLGYEVERRTIMSRRTVMGRWTAGSRPGETK